MTLSAEDSPKTVGKCWVLSNGAGKNPLVHAEKEQMVKGPAPGLDHVENLYSPAQTTQSVRSQTSQSV